MVSKNGIGSGAGFCELPPPPPQETINTKMVKYLIFFTIKLYMKKKRAICPLFYLLFQIIFLIFIHGMDKSDKIGPEKYTRGELSQLARRRMIQKDHGDKNKYNRKIKHKKSYE